MEETVALMQKASIEMDRVSSSTRMKGWNPAGHMEKVKEAFSPATKFNC